ncbi:MAG: hypothetical protein H0W49_09590 [Nitrospirales bacterium]|nr:hypothetical protein [Nitrospirales bacterium]MBA3964949.1 hypothetical protein [Nitrospirales bacterium]
MNHPMTISRSREEGMYLLREGDCVYPQNANGFEHQGEQQGIFFCRRQPG